MSEKDTKPKKKRAKRRPGPKRKPGPKPKKKPNKVGRKWLFEDKKIVTKLEEAFSIGANISEACFHAGIPRKSYYENIKQFPELSDVFEDMRARPHLRARNTVFEALQYDRHLAWDYLQKTHSDEFAAKKKHEHSGNLTVETVNYADTESDE